MRSSLPVLTALLLFSLNVRAGEPSRDLAAAPVGVSSSVGVFLDFEDRPARLTIETMEREVQSIMNPAGLRFSWRDLNDPKAVRSTFADLVVVKFRGSCSGVPRNRPKAGGADGEPVALADTKISNGKVLHFTDVYCNELRQYLGANAAPLRDSGRSLLYGRALGRIVSHEMWHIFAETDKHASGGVARACYTRQDLLQSVFFFDPAEEKILHEYAMRALLSMEANPAP